MCIAFLVLSWEIFLTLDSVRIEKKARRTNVIKCLYKGAALSVLRCSRILVEKRRKVSHRLTNTGFTVCTSEFVDNKRS